MKRKGKGAQGKKGREERREEGIKWRTVRDGERAFPYTSHVVI